MLYLLIRHLKKYVVMFSTPVMLINVNLIHQNRIADNSEKNLMTISNLGVCFGPTLLRAEEDSMAGILEIKFANVVVEILIENCDKVCLDLSSLCRLLIISITL